MYGIIFIIEFLEVLKMNKMLKRTLSVFLAVAMLTTLFLPSFAANKNNVKQYKEFTMIGDSVAAGFGLENVVPNGTYRSFYRNDQSFPDQVATAVGIERGNPNFHPLTCGSLRIVDFLYMLDKQPADYDIDEAINFLGTGHYNEIMAIKTQNDPDNKLDYGDDANTMKANLKESLANSDLIGVELGFNDVFWHPANAILSYAEEVNGDIPLILLKFIELIFQGYVQYVKYYPQVLKELRELNPTSDIMLISIYNPASNIKINDESKIGVGRLFNLVTDTMNMFLRVWAEKYNCIYVDVTRLEPTIQSLNVTEALSGGGLDFRDGGWDAHPSLEGHNFVTNLIINKLPTADGVLTPEDPILKKIIVRIKDIFAA